jgi:galactokinase
VTSRAGDYEPGRPRLAGGAEIVAAPAATGRLGEVDGVDIGRLAEEFRAFSGSEPEGIWRSPGRVNLIGEHTDYNEGLAVPFAIDRATFVAARATHRPASAPSGKKTLRVATVDLGQQAETDLAELARWGPLKWERWARYPLGVLWALHQRGAGLPAMDLVISSSVPRGGGLSSSAALTVSIAVAAADLAGLSLAPIELARVAQHAEAAFAGVPVGLLDQVAVLEGRRGEAVLIDFSTMATELVPMPAGPVTIIDTRVERDNASGAYADRRAACQKAASELGLSSLRQASLEMVESALHGQLLKRARHIVTENARVLEALQRLREQKSIGDLLVASHRSLRDDYEVSTPELDLAVETALAAGAEGARLTGAGLGGCAIALGAPAAKLAPAMAKAFAASGFKEPAVFAVSSSDGAGRIL